MYDSTPRNPFVSPASSSRERAPLTPLWSSAGPAGRARVPAAEASSASAAETAPAGGPWTRDESPWGDPVLAAANAVALLPSGHSGWPGDYWSSSAWTLRGWTGSEWWSCPSGRRRSPPGAPADQTTAPASARSCPLKPAAAEGGTGSFQTNGTAQEIIIKQEE